MPIKTFLRDFCYPARVDSVNVEVWTEAKPKKFYLKEKKDLTVLSKNFFPL